MEHQPPPFFKTGPTPLARLLIFSALSIALLVADTLFGYLTPLRQVAAAAVYPLQRIALAPGAIAQRIGEFFVTQSSLRSENARLAAERLSNAAQLQQLQALQTENAQLRELIEARKRLDVKVLAAEVLYAARDPFSRKIIVDKGLQNGVQAGQAVLDDRGVVGQVTRVYPWLAEVMQAIKKFESLGDFVAAAKEDRSVLFLESQQTGIRWAIFIPWKCCRRV